MQSAWPEQKRQAAFNLDDDVAIQGYDPVSYFSGDPQKGSKDITTDYKGVTYQFVSEANRTEFLSDPGKYEPAFGGWCAWAMADDGSKVAIDPKSYKIVDGHVYLFYNGLWGDTRKLWNEKSPAEEQQLAKKADLYWANDTD